MVKRDDLFGVSRSERAAHPGSLPLTTLLDREIASLMSATCRRLSEAIYASDEDDFDHAWWQRTQGLQDFVATLAGPFWVQWVRDRWARRTGGECAVEPRSQGDGNRLVFRSMSGAFLWTIDIHEGVGVDDYDPYEGRHEPWAGLARVLDEVTGMWADAAGPSPARPPAEAMRSLVARMAPLSDDERLAVFYEIASVYCWHCGCALSGHWCSCRNDE